MFMRKIVTENGLAINPKYGYRSRFSNPLLLLCAISSSSSCNFFLQFGLWSSVRFVIDLLLCFNDHFWRARLWAGSYNGDRCGLSQSTSRSGQRSIMSRYKYRCGGVIVIVSEHLQFGLPVINVASLFLSPLCILFILQSSDITLHL